MHGFQGEWMQHCDLKKKKDIVYHSLDHSWVCVCRHTDKGNFWSYLTEKMFMWQKVIMKINVNYLFHCKRLMPYKDKHNVQIVHVSLFLPCPRVLLIVSTVQSPDIVQILGLLVNLQFYIVSVCILCSIWFLLTSMLKRIFCNMAWAHLTVTQHVLIKMIFGIFAVSCTVHVNFINFLPHLKLNSTTN